MRRRRCAPNECGWRSRVAPDRARGVDDELQFAPLLAFGQQIAFERRRAAALRAERKILDRHVAAGFVDPAAEIVLRLERRELAAHQTENHRLASRNEAERFERAGALR